jgi:nitrate/nitrite transporter NarK
MDPGVVFARRLWHSIHPPRFSPRAIALSVLLFLILPALLSTPATSESSAFEYRLTDLETILQE